MSIFDRFRKKKRARFLPGDTERIAAFLVFCEGLEEHPFLHAHNTGGSFASNFSLPASGKDLASVNFDEIHLESFLTRLRQVFFKGELFYLKDLRRSVVAMYGNSKEFRRFYSKFWSAIRKPWPDNGIRVPKSNGEDVTRGFAFPQLIKARLYTGAIHSEKRIDPDAGPEFLGVADAHVLAHSHLSLVLASGAVAHAQNIFSLRKHILLLARIADKVDSMAEMTEFDTRCKDVGCSSNARIALVQNECAG